MKVKSAQYFGATKRSHTILEITTQELLAVAESLLVGAAANDDFVKIKTSAGNAVLISEAEWDIMVDALNMVLNAK